MLFSLSLPLTRHLFFSHSLKMSLHLTTTTATSSLSTSHTKPRLRGVVFDMDGTLTVPVIDFPAMYRAVLGEEQYLSIKAQNPSGIDILHHVETWGPAEQQKAYEIIADFEKQGLDRLQIMPGAAQLYGFLDSKNIRRGLITRNVKSSVDIFHERFGLTFSPAVSREFRPCKPDPAALLHICSTWGIHPSEVIMVGDSLKDDIAAAAATATGRRLRVLEGICLLLLEDWNYFSGRELISQLIRGPRRPWNHPGLLS